MLGNTGLTGWKTWLFRVTAAVFIPLLSFGTLESGLRVFGYGNPTDFFVKIQGRDAYTPNPRFGWRFFRPEIARRPEPYVLPARKGADTFRIFVLGESAAMGIPDPAFGFGRILEGMLRDRYPGIRFEVINAAMTAINSHAILPIVRDCAGRNGDLFIVYAGNNEVVGPYGAGTVFQAYSPSLRTIRLGIWLKSTRTGQLIEGLIRRLVKRDEGFTAWQGMEMFLSNPVPADDPRLEKVYDHFRQNLADICDVTRRSGAGVMVCTVATNLKDNAPFASVHRSGLTPSDLMEWERLYRQGTALAESGQHAGAVEAFLKAARYDSQFADLPFRLARSYLALGQFDKARERFLQARDLDALRFRADTRINEIIRQVADGREGQGVYLIDAVRAFELEEASHGIPGGELFYEHVHLNFDGNVLLAKALFERMAPILQVKFRDQTGRDVAAPSKAVCQAQVALTDWNDYEMQSQMAEMMDRPPFTHQLDYAQDRLRRYQALKAFRLQHVFPAAAKKAQARQVYQKAVERNPDDLSFRQTFVHLLQGNRDYDEAAAQCRALIDRIPDNPRFHGGLGDVLSLQGKYAEAMDQYREMQRLLPGLAAPYVQAGTALAKQGKLSEAAVELGRALEIDPGSDRTALAETFEARRRPDEARATLAAGLEIARRHRAERVEGIFLDRIGEVYYRQGNFSEALKCYQQALEASRAAQDGRGEAEALNNAGDACLALGNFPEALKSYETCLHACGDLDDLSGQANALSGIGNVLLKRDNAEGALRSFEAALEDQRELDDLSGQAGTLGSIGAVYAGKEDWEKALASYGQALKMQRTMGDLSGQAITLSAVGNVYIRKKAVEEALQSHAQALDLYKKTGNPLGQANALSNMGLCYAKQGKMREAFDLLMQARSLYLGMGDRGAEAQAVEEMLARVQQGK